MKLWKKGMGLMLSAILAGSMLAGCGEKAAGTDGADKDTNTAPVEEETQEQTQAQPEEEGKENVGGLELPLCEEKQELSVLVVWDNSLLDDPNEIKGIQKMEERTNVHINWITYDQTEMLEMFNLTLSTGDFPDILCPGGTNNYPGGYIQGIDDGVLVDMKDYLQFMPNYTSLLDSSEKATEQAMYDDGEFHAVRILQGTDTKVEGGGSAYGMTYRSDILEKMGEELPETVDEWHDLLVKCRDNGMAAPMTLETDGGTALSLAWGVNTDWSSNYWQYDYNTDKVGFGPLQDGFEEWLGTMAEWYQEGLIDKNFTNGCIPIITGDYSNIENDQTMLFDCMFGFQNGTFLNENGFITNEECYLQAIDGVVLKAGDEVMKCSDSSCVGNEIFVTTNCEDPELAAKWLDYLYSQEGMFLMHYGIEGESYTLDENKEPVYTDAILHPSGDLSPNQELSLYAMKAYMGYNNGEAGDRLSIATSPNGVSAQVESIEIWKSPEKTVSMPVGISLSTEEDNTINTYLTDIITYCQEYMVKTIIGEDTVSYEEFVKGLDSYGIQECIDAYQSACDRFYSR